LKKRKVSSPKKTSLAKKTPSPAKTTAQMAGLLLTPTILQLFSLKKAKTPAPVSPLKSVGKALVPKKVAVRRRAKEQGQPQSTAKPTCKAARAQAQDLAIALAMEAKGNRTSRNPRIGTGKSPRGRISYFHTERTKISQKSGI
jgi:hypothetical protein